MTHSSGADQRKHPRIGVTVTVELTLPLQGTLTLMTRDISDGGAFLVKGAQDLPPVGAVVYLKTTDTLGGGEEPPTLKAEVVRVIPDGMGLRFID